VNVMLLFINLKPKIMKNKIYTLSALVFLVLFTSCKKEDIDLRMQSNQILEPKDNTKNVSKLLYSEVACIEYDENWNVIALGKAYKGSNGNHAWHECVYSTTPPTTTKNINSLIPEGMTYESFVNMINTNEGKKLLLEKGYFEVVK